MGNTSNKRADLSQNEYKVINLKYEYEGYTGTEQWAVISELSKQELFEKYPDEIQRYVPFVLLSVEQGEVIKEYERIEDKHRKRRIRSGDAFGYEEGMTEYFHAEAIVPDFVEQQEANESYNNRQEQKMQLFVKAMSDLTEKQYKYLIMHYLEGMSAREIAKAERVSHQVIDRHILAATRKVKKVFADFFGK